MTAIVGLKHEDKIYIGGDSAASHYYRTEPRQESKVFRNGEFVFGFTDSFRMGNLLQYKLTPPRLPIGDQPSHQFMVTEFIDAVRECLKNGGFASKDKDVESAGAFLVGVKDQLYYIDSDYQVGTLLSGYTAVGSGGEIALGSLFSTTDQEPEERVRTALEAAAEYSPYVSPPFTILST